ncbi:hypothetical protein NPIL_283802 [Nephila pilipes]|uniref:Uncharacterized protein n=1 Tax=Nephila pilipes TaxID=299642 RepID=A0A8X6NDY8_NEPPI|nr:hypothetical protein NPIL_283802 [Nephila pilipes]
MKKKKALNRINCEEFLKSKKKSTKFKKAKSAEEYLKSYSVIPEQKILGPQEFFKDIAKTLKSQVTERLPVKKRLYTYTRLEQSKEVGDLLERVPDDQLLLIFFIFCKKIWSTLENLWMLLQLTE